MLPLKRNISLNGHPVSLSILVCAAIFFHRGYLTIYVCSGEMLRATGIIIAIHVNIYYVNYNCSNMSIPVKH